MNVKGYEKSFKIPEDFHNSFYYVELYPKIQGTDPVVFFNERDLAEYVKKYPQLHSKMCEMISIITAFPRMQSAFQNDMSSTRPGYTLAKALALYDDKYCDVLVGTIENGFLGDEGDINDTVETVIEKWGITDNTAKLVIVRAKNTGQNGRKLVKDMIAKYGNELEKYKLVLNLLTFMVDNALQD